MNSSDNPQTSSVPNVGNEVLSRQQMEELLADYAFDQLSALEKAQFEHSLSTYPDLMTDVEELRSAFAIVDTETEATERNHAQRLKNLSVHVQNRLMAERVATARRWKFFRFLMPALAAASAVMVMLLPEGATDYLMHRSSASPFADMIRPHEASLIFDDESLNDGISDADIALADHTVDDAINGVLAEKESLLAARLIDHDTLKALSSADGDDTDNDLALLQDIDDDDVDDSDVQAIFTQM